jgi:hypothetical protein
MLFGWLAIELMLKNLLLLRTPNLYELLGVKPLGVKAGEKLKGIRKDNF